MQTWNGEASPGADVAGVSPVAVQVWPGRVHICGWDSRVCPKAPETLCTQGKVLSSPSAAARIALIVWHCAQHRCIAASLHCCIAAAALLHYCAIAYNGRRRIHLQQLQRPALDPDACSGRMLARMRVALASASMRPPLALWARVFVSGVCGIADFACPNQRTGADECAELRTRVRDAQGHAHALTTHARLVRRDATRCDAMRCDAMRCDAMRCDAGRARVPSLKSPASTTAAPCAIAANLCARLATCQVAACNMQLQHATCNAHFATWKMQHAACNMQHAVSKMQHATCSMQHAACSVRDATCNAQQGKSCNALYATCNAHNAT